MGTSAAATGVLFWTGSFTTSGECIASGLVQRFGSLDCITDNAGCFADAAFPKGGSIIHFGDHHVYVVVVSEEYPSEVLTLSDPPPVGGGSYDSSIDPCTDTEVMMAGSGNHNHHPLLSGRRTELKPPPRCPSPALWRRRSRISVRPSTLAWIPQWLRLS
jgi:hypothetical protein